MNLNIFSKLFQKFFFLISADGLIVEAHPDPINSISDPDQAISFDEFGEIVELSKDAASLYSTN